MARKPAAQGDNLLIFEGEAIPVGMREKCAGCLGDIDLREKGWVILGDRSFSHGGEACWRKAVERELVTQR